MTVDPINIIGVVLVALITAAGAWASQRTAAKSSRQNAKETAELEAYDRARNMDLKTIQRQDEEIEELKTNYKELHKRFVKSQIDLQKARVIIRALRRKAGYDEDVEDFDE